MNNKEKEFRKLIFKNDRKSIIGMIVVISLISFICVAIVEAIRGTDKYLYDSNANGIMERTLEVYAYIKGFNPDDYNTLEDLQKFKIDHVVDIQNNIPNYNADFSGIAGLEKFSNPVVNLRPVHSNELFKVVKGRALNFSQPNELVCPTKLLPVYDSEYNDYTLKDYLNGEDLLGKQITTNYGTFTIVGLYNNNYLYNEQNVCFASQNVFNTEVLDNGYGVIFYAAVDDYKNLADVIKTYKDLGYDVEPISTNDGTFINNLHLMSTGILVLIIIIGIVCTMTLIKRDIKNNYNQIKLYKVMGYDNKIIEKYYQSKTNYIAIFSLIISIILYGIGVLVYKFMATQKVILSLINVNISVVGLLLILFVSLIIPFVCMKLSIKKHLKIQNIIIDEN